MKRHTQISLLVLAAISFTLAGAPANAADVAGKWYGKLDSVPIVVIDKIGSGYSGSLANADSTREIKGSIGTWHHQEIHKSLISFAVADGNVRFSIRSMISMAGDTNYAREDYNLTLSDDGGQMTGTVRRIALNGSGLTDDPVPQTVTPITLYPTDYTTRSQTQAQQP